VTRILVVDNYDSFTWNLVQLVEALGASVEVVRNDGEPPAAWLARAPDGVVLSPGPGAPERAGATLEAVASFGAAGIPVLGVCLGHQAIAVACGARLARARAPRHGKVAKIRHDGRGVFAASPQPLAAALYHSLVVDPETLPDALEVSARSPEGEVMAIRHRRLALEGVQFHPESVLMPEGPPLVERFLARCGAGAPA
jgi:anthranilate synthase/aminodeoxychorismate synthase-like glutamine amidotransferase